MNKHTDSAKRKRNPRGTGTVVRKYIGVKIKGRRRWMHDIIAEKALGRPLRGTELVHHFDENGFNNDPSNLVICPNQAYHFLLHLRQKALASCGNPDWRACVYCRRYDDPAGMIRHSNNRFVHPECKRIARGVPPRPLIACANCGTPHQKKRFCSAACSTKWWNDSRRARCPAWPPFLDRGCEQ